ncbi:MAG: ATPase [Victivallales bacterium]|jgi:D-xylose transport system permease protein|nr:ATPase [Victivallales bacterium]MBT7166580.1 ATPase [Victivallales bacterium]MBT7299391.1 ATPase [Victivallales bacterium]
MKRTLSIRDFSIGAALLCIWVFFAFHPRTAGVFLTPRNLSNLSIEFAVRASLALGMLVVLLPGMIDLSAGSGVGMIGGIAAVLIFHHGWSAPAAMGVGFLVGMVVWSGMGYLISSKKMPAFIITLGGMMAFKGLFWRIIGCETVPVTAGNSENLISLLTTYSLPRGVGLALWGAVSLAVIWAIASQRRRRRAYGFEVEPWQISYLKGLIFIQIALLFTVTMNRFRGIPLAMVVLGLVAVFIYVLTRHTPFGRYLYAIGGNEEAAVLSGVSVLKVTTCAFLVQGVIVALAGFMQTAYAGASTTTVGEGMELDAIAACVIGGTSLTGGRGNVLGVLAGSLIMVSLLNGMVLMTLPQQDRFVARGVVLVLAVWMDLYLSRRK